MESDAAFPDSWKAHTPFCYISTFYLYLRVLHFLYKTPDLFYSISIMEEKCKTFSQHLITLNLPRKLKELQWRNFCKALNAAYVTRLALAWRQAVVLPSQDGWQHSVKSGAEGLEENSLLQRSQTFKVWRTQRAGSSVTHRRNSHLFLKVDICLPRFLPGSVFVCGSCLLACVASAAMTAPLRFLPL